MTSGLEARSKTFSLASFRKTLLIVIRHLLTEEHSLPIRRILSKRLKTMFVLTWRITTQLHSVLYNITVNILLCWLLWLSKPVRCNRINTNGITNNEYDFYVPRTNLKSFETYVSVACRASETNILIQIPHGVNIFSCFASLKTYVKRTADSNFVVRIFWKRIHRLLWLFFSQRIRSSCSLRNDQSCNRTQEHGFWNLKQAECLTIETGMIC